jgi:hypothetical protein
VSMGDHPTWPWSRGVSWKWTDLPVLARPGRWVNGTSGPCSSGCLPASRRAARRDSAPSRQVDLRPGGAMVMVNQEFGKFHAVIEQVEPP